MTDDLITHAYATPAVVVGRILNPKDAIQERIKTKQNTAVAIGDILYYDTTGFAPATPTIVAAATKRYKFYVATEACAAVTSTSYYIKAVRGPGAVVGVSATVIAGTGTLNTGIRGCRVANSATAGKVILSTKPTDTATQLCEVGTLHGDVASGDAGYWVMLD
jgi:hypothetical protein